MARKIPTPAKRPLPALPVAEAIRATEKSETQSCGNCRCFSSTDPSNSKGRCRFFPPANVSERDATLEDQEGKRWTVCWESEWCYQWVAR